MKLTYDDFENKKFMFIPEEQMCIFMDKALEDAVKETSNVLQKKPELTDIKEFLIAHMAEFLTSIKELKNVFFVNNEENPEHVWNVIVDNDVIIFDYYNLDEENKMAIRYFNYELHILNSGECEANLSVSEYMKNEEPIDIDILELDLILRLMLFIVLILDGRIK